MEADSLPTDIEPMKASLAEIPSVSDGWATEIKWDGVRAISFCKDGELRLQGRRLNDITGLFPEIEPLGRQTAAEGTVLDGEMVAFDEDGIPSFQRIQKRLRQDGERLRNRSYVATFIIFDLLYADGVDMRDRPYSERREQLEARGLNGPTWQTPDYLEVDIGDGRTGIGGPRRETPFEPLPGWFPQPRLAEAEEPQPPGVRGRWLAPGQGFEA